MHTQAEIAKEIGYSQQAVDSFLKSSGFTTNEESGDPGKTPQEPETDDDPNSLGRIRDLWLACWSQEEIAERENVTKETVSEISQKMADLPKSDKSHATHAADFDPPIYNIWKQQEKTAGLTGHSLLALPPTWRGASF